VPGDLAAIVEVLHGEGVANAFAHQDEPLSLRRSAVRDYSRHAGRLVDPDDCIDARRRALSEGSDRLVWRLPLEAYDAPRLLIDIGVERRPIRSG